MRDTAGVMMLPTPLTDHISGSTYPPSEDSYLLLDALSSASEKSFLSQRFKSPSQSPLIVEIGTGSGVVLAFITGNAEIILGRSDVLALGTDVNTAACSAAEETTRSYNPHGCKGVVIGSSTLLGCLHCDLTNAVTPGLIDLLVFNPPYVPSDAVPSLDLSVDASGFERDNAFLALATDGGADGMEVTDRVLQSLPNILSGRGVAYILFCQRNRPDRVIERIRSWGRGQQWTADKVQESGMSGGFEKLSIVRIARR